MESVNEMETLKALLNTSNSYNLEVLSNSILYSATNDRVAVEISIPSNRAHETKVYIHEVGGARLTFRFNDDSTNGHQGLFKDVIMRGNNPITGSKLFSCIEAMRTRGR